MIPDLTSSLLRFATIGLGYEKINVEEHGHILNLLQNEALSLINKTNKSQRVIQILLPRGTFKTTIASVSFPMWLLQKNPNLRIMLDSETYNLAKSILSEIKQQYQYGPYTQHYEPVDPTKMMRWAEDSIILPGRTVPKKEGNFAAAGLDGVKAGMHYDVIIADDLHSQNNTRTRYQIDGVIEHYRLLLSILEPNGLLVVIGTRWAEDDAYTVIEKDVSASLFIPASSVKPINIAPVAVEIEEPALVYDHISDTSVKACRYFLNFPKTLSLQHLLSIEKRQSAYIFSAQYLLRPVASKESRFKEEWLQFFEESDIFPGENETGFDPHKIKPIKSSGMRKIGLIDPAFSTGEYSDYSGIVIVAADSTRNMYIDYADQHRLEPYALIDKILELRAIHDVQEWYVEEVAAQKVLRFFLEYMMGKDETKKFHVGPLKSFGRKKELRMMSLQPYFSNNKIFLRKEQSVLLHQIRRFPILTNDDVLDALAYAPQVVFDGECPSPISYRSNFITMADLRKEISDRDKQEGIRPLSWNRFSSEEVNFYGR